MDLEKRVQRLQGNFQPGLEGKGSFGYGTFLPMVDGSKNSSRSQKHHPQNTNSQTNNQQMRGTNTSHTSVSADPNNDDVASQLPDNSTENTSPSKIIQVMTIPLGPLLSPFISVPNSSENQVQQMPETIVEETKPVQEIELPAESVSVSEKIEDQNQEQQKETKGITENQTQPLVGKLDENKEMEKATTLPKDNDKKEQESGLTSKSQTPEMTKERARDKSSGQDSTSNEKAKDRKSKSNDKYRTDDKKSKDREESREKKTDKKIKESKDNRTKEKKLKKSQEKELDKKKDKRDQTRTRSSSRSSSRSRSRERDRGRNYDRDRDYKEKRRRRSYSYSSDNGNSSSPSRSRYSSSDSERDHDSRKRRRKGKSRSRSRSRDRKEREKDRKDRDRSKISKKRKRSKSRDRSTGKSIEELKKSKSGTESNSNDTANLSATNAKDASIIAEECKKNATKLKHVADKLSDKSQAGEIYFQSGLQFLACAHAYEEGNMHDKAVMMYQQTGTFFESIAKMYSHDDKFKVLVAMCCKCVAVALSRRFILDPSRLRQLHADVSSLNVTSNSTTNSGTPNSPPSSTTQSNNLDPSPPQTVSTSPSLPSSSSSNTERSSASQNNLSSQPTVRLKGEKQQNLFDMIKCFEMWGRAEKNLSIQHFSMTNVKELIQSLTQYAKTNLTTASTSTED